MPDGNGTSNGHADVHGADIDLGPFVPALPGGLAEPAAPAVPVAAPGSGDDDRGGEFTPVPVDSGPDGDGRMPWERPAERRPVVQPWLRDPVQVRQAARWAVAEWTHPVRFHGVRLPLYALRLAAGSPRGAWRVAVRTWRWVTDAESKALTTAAAGSGDAKAAPAYLGLSRQHGERVKHRSTVAATVAGSWVLAEGLLYYTVDPVLDVPVVSVDVPVPWALANAAGVLVLGWYGRLREHPVISNRLTGSGAAPRLTSDIVIRALGAAGITGMTAKNAETIDFVGVGIGRDAAGWLAQLDLPDGVTVAAVLEKRDRLAAGLRRPLGAVWPEAVPGEHPGRLHLYVADKDVAAVKPGSSNLTGQHPQTKIAYHYVPFPAVELRRSSPALPPGSLGGGGFPQLLASQSESHPAANMRTSPAVTTTAWDAGGLPVAHCADARHALGIAPERCPPVAFRCVD